MSVTDPAFGISIPRAGHRGVRRRWPWCQTPCPRDVSGARSRVLAELVLRGVFFGDGHHGIRSRFKDGKRICVLESLVSTFFLHTCSHTFSAADALNKQPPPLPPAAPLPHAQPIFPASASDGFCAPGPSEKLQSTFRKWQDLRHLCCGKYLF